MRDFKFIRLEKYRVGGTKDNMELSYPLPHTETGKVLRFCPNENCTPRRFQLLNASEIYSVPELMNPLIRREPGTAGCTCPYCGTDADDSDFTAPEDIDSLNQTIEWAIEQDVGDVLEQFAKEINHSFGRQKGLFSTQMDFNRPRRSEPKPWREDLLRDLTCDICNRRYGVYAIGLFCPDCGSRNLSVHFKREVEMIVGQLDLAEQIKKSGEKELSYRMLGNAHEDVVTAFETYLKSTFIFTFEKRFSEEERVKVRKDLKGNPFQNIDRSIKLYSYLSIDPFNNLSDEEMLMLRLNIDKRHVVGHNLGIADEKFTEVSEDSALGETVNLLASEIEDFANLCYTVIKNIESCSIELLPPK